jgi:hypothetical protein
VAIGQRFERVPGDQHGARLFVHAADQRLKLEASILELR